MRGRHGDAVDPGSDAIPLGADIAEDAPDGGSAENDSDRQNDHELRDFRSFSIKQQRCSPSRLESAADCRPREGFENAVDERVEKQDDDGTEQKGHSQERDAQR